MQRRAHAPHFDTQHQREPCDHPVRVGTALHRAGGGGRVLGSRLCPPYKLIVYASLATALRQAAGGAKA